MNAQPQSIDLVATDAEEATCFHCNEPIPAGTHIHALIRNQPRAMCCEGCRAVAELISSAGLQDYYQYRNEPALKPANDSDEFTIYAQRDIAEQYVRVDGTKHSTTLLVDGIRCAACSWLIDRMLRRDANVKDVDVNVATSRVRIVWQGDSTYLANIMRMLANTGYRPHVLDASGLQEQAQQERRSTLKRLGVAGVGMMQVMMYVLPTYIQSDMDTTVRHYLQLTGLLLTTPVLFYAGWPFLQSAARALRRRSINMDVPVAIALVLAYGASVINTLRGHGETYFDSVSMFIFLLTLARFVVMSVRHHNQSIADALVRMQPRIAHRIVDHVITDIPVKQLAINDIVQIRAGETIPADGIVVNGQSSMDESLLTGESLPVNREVGDTVLAGSVNVANVIEIKVARLGQHTVMSGMLALLERPQTCKPKSVTFADKISRWFLQALLIATTIVGLAWYFIDPSRAFNIVLAVLVVTCPCALSLAAPAVIAATTTA
ncbi:MAG TPA: heavy metal translocating P-type ATPase metal-binding domain-containing protein, partial [Steroidobacteraceae bacterium]|nr:heavy metal translocating P-type ATPase metal-binding domain-containing protein [Steroidobacteraceae bacterium]